MNNINSANAAYSFRKVATIHAKFLKIHTQNIDRCLKSILDNPEDIEHFNNRVISGIVTITNILWCVERDYKKSPQSPDLTKLVSEVRETRELLKAVIEKKGDQDLNGVISKIEMITPIIKKIANNLEKEPAISEIIVKAMKDFCKAVKQGLTLAAKAIVEKVRPQKAAAQSSNEKNNNLTKPQTSYVEKVNQPSLSRKRQI